MLLPEKVIPLYNAYLAVLPPGAPEPARVDAWYFCDNEIDANELGSLALQGIKTATASLGWSYTAGADPLPVVGGLSIITAWDGSPLCIIETTRVYILPFNEVDAEQAYQEGEGARTLEYWREAHWRFFSRECENLGLAPTPEMPVVCERFRVVYRPRASDGSSSE
jgi:uncharacterized protein YhfF